MVLNSPPELMSPTSAASPIISTTIIGEISRFRESVESLLLGAPNLVHLCYWHVRLLIHRLTATSQHYDLHELLTPASRIAQILNQRVTGITPLNHHFAALSALTLIELSEFEECRDAAREGLAEIEAAIGGRKGLMAREDSQGWDSAIRIAVERGLQRVQDLDKDAQVDGGAASAGLQNLADAAVSGQEKHGDTARGQNAALEERAAKEFDPTALTRFGYLAALVREEVR